MGHPDIEIAVEKNAHGALTAEEAAEVVRHLAQCESCRLFQNTVHATEQAMNAMSQQLEATISWDTVHQRSSQGRRRFAYEGLIYAGLGAALWVATVRAWSNRDMLSTVAFFAVPALFFVALTVRSFVGVVRPFEGGPLVAARREIQLTLRETRAWQLVLALICLAGLGNGGVEAVLALLGIFALQHYRIAPLSRELNELGEGAK